MPLSYRVQLIPRNRPQRLGYIMWGGRPSSLTVHNVGKKDSTAKNNADYFGNNNLSASAHIFVDDVEAVLCIPLNEHALHCGTTAGNSSSGSIEVCEFTDPARQAKADENAKHLIADMLTGRAPAGFQTPHLSIANVRTHQSWMQYGTSGKYCPRILLPRWEAFKSEISELIAPPAPKTALVYLHASSAVAMQEFIIPAWIAGFAAYPLPVGQNRSGGYSYEDALSYIPTHGASATQMFPEPNGVWTVGGVHCTLEYARKLKAKADGMKLGSTIYPCGELHRGFGSMTEAVAASLLVGVNVADVFGGA